MKDKKYLKVGTPMYIFMLLPKSQKDESLLEKLNEIADISKREEVFFRLKVYANYVAISNRRVL